MLFKINSLQSLNLIVTLNFFETFDKKKISHQHIFIFIIIYGIINSLFLIPDSQAPEK